MVEMSERLQEIAHKLGERVKELNCLYGITRLVEQHDASLEDILQGVVELIPPSWQYPGVTCARIEVAQGTFVTSNYRATPWCQTEPVLVNHENAGQIEVCYLEEMPPSDEGPFLIEERHLIHVVAERLGHIIEQKMAEERLQTLYEQEKELRQCLETEAQRRIAFTRDLIHELKTPLTSLLATSQLLYDEERGRKLEKLAGYVWEGATSLNERIDDLHDVIKGEIGGLKLDMKPVKLAGLMKAIVEETRPLARQSGCEVRLDLSGRLPLVIADAARLRQVMFNLLNNAFKYAPGSGEVLIRARTESGMVRITVQDRGPGIPAREQVDIFLPGYQSERDRSSAGLGIGLALCRLIIEAHGGNISVASREGQGAGFSFTLPAAPKTKPERAS